MKQLTWLLKWILRAAIFFALLAFALNNQHDVTVNWAFGYEWSAPMVLVILAAFTLGLVAGVLGVLPRWLKQRKAARRARNQASLDPTTLNPKSHES